MKVIINDNTLGKIADNKHKLIAEYGEERANKIMMRIDELKSAPTLEDTRALPGNYDELTGDRKGEWVCNLDRIYYMNRQYRLIFVPHEEPISNDEHAYVRVEIKGVEVTEMNQNLAVKV